MLPNRQTLVALTQGDPAGIGPDITLSVWLNRKPLDLPPFLYIGDPAVLLARGQQLGVHIDCKEATPETAGAMFDSALPFFPIGCDGAVEAGVPSTLHAKGTIAAIETAVDLALSGRVSAITTNPIAKSVLYDAGFQFPGHTEFLADLAGRVLGRTVHPVMLLAGPDLKTVPVTIHIPLRDVSVQLTTELIVETCRIIHNDFVIRFGIANPRLAIAGLNPHAGENGALGKEDDLVIKPAITQLVSEGINAFGPLPADTMFHARARETYDVAVCMYHDQALIPAKALGFDDAVNVTLGLPFIRTSPDHGTAFSLAGKGIARADSLIAALRLAATLASNTTGPSYGSN